MGMVVLKGLPGLIVADDSWLGGGHGLAENRTVLVCCDIRLCPDARIVLHMWRVGCDDNINLLLGSPCAQATDTI
jgi:hypothetical protein